MFITLEDETSVANLVWPKVFEAHRHIMLGAGMIGLERRIQREGEVVHFVVHQIEDLSRELASVGMQGERFHCSGNGEIRVNMGLLEAVPVGPKARNMYTRDLHLDAIRVKTRDFR